MKDGPTLHPLTPERWRDLERLFGPRGAAGGCWCMWWRLSRSEFERQRGAGTKRAFRRLVRSAEVPPGVLAYADGRPIGWCAIAPRHELPRLDRSRALKRVDDQPVWSVTCFFVDRAHRQQGVTAALLEAAVALAARHGATILEGYPHAPRVKRVSDAFVFTGLVSTFRRAGFREVARRSETRPLMRRRIPERQ